MGIYSSNLKAYLAWAMSKTTEAADIIAVLRSLMISQVENTANGFAITGTSAHGTSISYGTLSTSGGLTVSEIQTIFELLYTRCIQAKAALEAKGLQVTDAAIEALVRPTLARKTAIVMSHRNPKGI